MDTKAPHVLAVSRPELLAVVGFLEGAGSNDWCASGLRDWLDAGVVAMGCMARPSVVCEAPVGPMPLSSSPSDFSGNHGLNLRKLLAAARSRVLATLRGLRDVPSDDRFLAAAIFARHVRRVRNRGDSTWVARPGADAPLSAIVISLLAVDVLSHREQYDQQLGVCDVCGRIWFDQIPQKPTRCSEHPPAEHSQSGFIHATSPRPPEQSLVSRSSHPRGDYRGHEDG